MGEGTLHTRIINGACYAYDTKIIECYKKE